MDLQSITGMDIPPSQYHRLDVYTTNGTVSVSLDEVIPCVRPSCWACTDMTSEWSDLSVGAARLPEGWEEARAWNQVIVRTERGEELIARAKARGVLRFREVPAGAMEKLKKAAANKKRAGVATLAQKSGRPEDLIYLDPADPLIAPFCSGRVGTEV
jgi:coenzyme F420 hydrogenase subunit beta